MEHYTLIQSAKENPTAFKDVEIICVFKNHKTCSKCKIDIVYNKGKGLISNRKINCVVLKETFFVWLQYWLQIQRPVCLFSETEHTQFMKLGKCEESLKLP